MPRFSPSALRSAAPRQMAVSSTVWCSSTSVSPVFLSSFLSCLSLLNCLSLQPAASVSGFYFAHPQSTYFAVGKVNRDQVQDYAQRKGMELKDAEYWLAPNLGYDKE